MAAWCPLDDRRTCHTDRQTFWMGKFGAIIKNRRQPAPPPEINPWTGRVVGEDAPTPEEERGAIFDPRIGLVWPAGNGRNIKPETDDARERRLKRLSKLAAADEERAANSATIAFRRGKTAAEVIADQQEQSE